MRTTIRRSRKKEMDMLVRSIEKSQRKPEKPLQKPVVTKHYMLVYIIVMPLVMMYFAGLLNAAAIFYAMGMIMGYFIRSRV